MTDRDPLWYKDAVIYQLHIKAFFDSNDDGIGDFKGLTSKLDYLKDLGVTALWLLPFYPSPLRDDGYDIADYREVNPRYGTMADFKIFVREAHKRDLKVITELVINHTSDQHPWFQRARAAKPGSNHRNYYVWSDSDEKYAGTRIIFLDTEKSNWTFDPVAKQYYWHRFYSHQPDLNFDNPDVVRAVISVMRFWLDLGVDGMRLDAVPYLIEREGTNNENLPPTHDVLKQLRAEVDKHYEGRMLLAEANQWPEDVLPYFGDGDECHMAFHFPLMPRLYMALAQEDRHPITDIMRQTPDIPDNCQWAIFLRNHDELTLEMVSDRERDYLWNTYAADPRGRINLGIRRRLAPLLDNDGSRIDLLNALLMSMPGTPVMYYGDEIGMGDNIFLGDRDGVRTPMQWSLDRNGGFSRTDPARLYLPVIQDAVYGYQAVNVEAQSRLINSLLQKTRRMVSIRKTYQVFGRGSLQFLYPSNRRVLAYLRQFDGVTILCVFNLSRSAQAVELPLEMLRGRIPVEMLGRSPFPAITDRPFALTLPGYSYFWFELMEPKQVENMRRPNMSMAEPAGAPELVTLVLPKGWSALVEGHSNRELVRDVIPAFLPGQRWFGAKDRSIRATRLLGVATLPAPAADPNHDGWALSIVDVEFADGSEARYLVPLGVLWALPGHETRTALLPQTLAQARRFRSEGVLYDAGGDDGLALAILDELREGRSVAFSGGGEFRFQPTGMFDAKAIPEHPAAKRLGGEQSNSSILIEDFAVLKTYRALHQGINPEIEMTRFLTERAGFPGTPPVLGIIELVQDGQAPVSLGIVTGFVPNQGDAWSWVQDYLRRSFGNAGLAFGGGTDDGAEDPHTVFLSLAAQLGKRTAELHQALAGPEAEAEAEFAPEPVTRDDMQRWRRSIDALLSDTLKALGGRITSDLAIDDATRSAAARLFAADAPLKEVIGAGDIALDGLSKSRFHGDYHLGQVLFVQNDFSIIDFEGEPRRTIEERRNKHSPLKDVAGMVRSFDYAAWAAIKTLSDLPAMDATVIRTFCLEWRDRTIRSFLDGYAQQVGPEGDPSAGSSRGLLRLLLLEKAIYEIGYELANRPNWLSIPLEGVLGLLELSAAAP